MVTHNGGLGGYVSLLTMFPDLNIGIFGNTNGPGYMTRDALRDMLTTTWQIADNLFGEEQWLNISTSCSLGLNPVLPPTSEPSNETPIVTPEDKTRYMGTYGHVLFGEVTVRKPETETDKWMSIHIGMRMRGVLLPTITKDSFALDIIALPEVKYSARIGNTTVNAPLYAVFRKSPGAELFDTVDIRMDPTPTITFSRHIRFADAIPLDPPTTAVASTTTCSCMTTMPLVPPTTAVSSTTTHSCMLIMMCVIIMIVCAA
jgi:hypothetical protein